MKFHFLHEFLHFEVLTLQAQHAFIVLTHLVWFSFVLLATPCREKVYERICKSVSCKCQNLMFFGGFSVIFVATCKNFYWRLQNSTSFQLNLFLIVLLYTLKTKHTDFSTYWKNSQRYNFCMEVWVLFVNLAKNCSN